MKNEDTQNNNQMKPTKNQQGVNPLWFLAAMGLLIVLVLIAELLGWKK